ncbi:MAG: anaerobic sulfatase maturase [Anaerolineae bacterium]
MDQKHAQLRDDLSLLIKPVSGDCNLHCTYCFYHERSTDPYLETKQHVMSADTLDTLIRQGMALHPAHAAFGWQGGEPALAGLEFYQQVVKLQQRYGSRGQIVSNGLQTNGILLDPAWARFLREYRFLVGLSLDGPAIWHDKYRQTNNGKPTHLQVTAALRLLRRYNVETNVLTVVNRDTAQHPYELYDYFLNQDLHYLQFIPCVEFDPQSGQPTEFSVTPELFGDFMCALFDRWYNHGRPECSIRDFDAMLAVFMGQPSPMCCYQPSCGSYVVVEYNGDIYPCDFYVEQAQFVGNIKQMSLEEAFQSQVVQEFAMNKSTPRPECAACAWMNLCQQGCPRFLHQGKHYLCGAYQRLWAHSQAAFQSLAQGLHDPSTRQAVAQVGRNDPCPCGSGLKYKQCCGRKSQ